MIQCTVFHINFRTCSLRTQNSKLQYGLINITKMIGIIFELCTNSMYRVTKPSELYRHCAWVYSSLVRATSYRPNEWTETGFSILRNNKWTKVAGVEACAHLRWEATIGFAYPCLHRLIRSDRWSRPRVYIGVHRRTLNESRESVKCTRGSVH